MAIPKSQPPINYSSQGAIACKHILLNPLKDLWLVSDASAPVNGDGNGWLGLGSLVIDVTNGKMYQNTGTMAATVFTPFEAASAGLPALDAITAHAGGGKASATALGYGINRISVCATAADSVLMPPAIKGAEVILINDGAAAAQVFGQGTDTIDAVATATGVALTNAKRDVFYCATAGAWQSLEGVKSV